MIEIKVKEEIQDGVKGVQTEINLEGPKDDVIAELILAISKIIKDNFSLAERFAFFKTLIDMT